VSLDQAGGDERSNLQPLCHECHADTSPAELGAQRKPVLGVDG
jgi:hypothetical protein